MDNLTALIKRAALEAVDAGKPSQIAYGKVINEKPLQVKVSEKLILTSEVLIVPEYLTEHEVTLKTAPDIEIKYTVMNALKVGDQVVMLRNRGGQQYLIIDRTVKK